MKKVWVVVIPILAILLLGAGAWWLAETVGKRAEQITNKPAPMPTPIEFTNDVKLYMIAPNDEGKQGEKIGCNDSAVEVVHTVTKTDILAGTYEDLLALSETAYGESGLQNTLAGSDLKLVSASLGDDGTAKIVVNGTLKLEGDCDLPRVKAQLEKPAEQFPGVKSVNVTLNGQPLSDLQPAQ